MYWAFWNDRCCFAKEAKTLELERVTSEAPNEAKKESFSMCCFARREFVFCLSTEGYDDFYADRVAAMPWYLQPPCLPDRTQSVAVRSALVDGGQKRAEVQTVWVKVWTPKNPHHHPEIELEATWDQFIGIYVTSGTLNQQGRGKGAGKLDAISEGKNSSRAGVNTEP